MVAGEMQVAINMHGAQLNVAEGRNILISRCDHASITPETPELASSMREAVASGVGNSLSK
jgi:hypothetical protein